MAGPRNGYGSRVAPHEPRGTEAAPRWLVHWSAVAWRAGVLVAAAVLALYLLWRIRVAVVPVVVALLAATVLSPPVRWLERRGWPPVLATWAVFGGSLLVFGGFAWFAVPRVVDELQGIGDEVSTAWDELRDWLVANTGLTEGTLDRWQASVGDRLSGSRGSLVDGAFTSATLAVEIIAGALAAMVLTFFFVKDGPRISAWILDQLHGTVREDAAEVGRRAWRVLGGYVRGTTVNGLVEGSVTAVALVLLGVPLVVPLAVITFLAAYLPFVGAIVAGAIATAVALATEGWVTALLVLALYVAIQQLEGDLLAPLILGRTVKLHPVVILVSIVAFGVIAGIIGAFVAVPTVATIAAVVPHFRERVARSDGQRPAGRPMEPVRSR